MALAGAGAVAGLALALSFNHFAGTGTIAAQQPVEAARVVPGNAQQVNLSFAPVAKRVQPAVVNIFTARVVRQRQAMGPFYSMFDSQPRVENSLG